MPEKVKTYTPQDRAINAKLYKNFLMAELDDGWPIADKQSNFKIFSQIFKYTCTSLNQSSILDAGCGTGDLVGFIDKLPIKDYLGVDIYSPAIKKARTKYPHHQFQTADFLTMTNHTKFDFVFSSGALSTKLQTDNYHILASWVRKMWTISTKGAVFNVLLQRHLGDQHNLLFVYNRAKVLEICAEIIADANIKIHTTDADSGDGTQEMHVFLYR